jgi:hypothetical protein
MNNVSSFSNEIERNPLCSTLNFVSDGARNDLIMRKALESDDDWLFSFKFDGNETESKILTSIEDYFQYFSKISFKSKIFVHVEEKNGRAMRFYEVLWKSGGNLIKNSVFKMTQIVLNFPQKLSIMIF